MNKKIVVYFLGWVLLTESVSMVIPCIISMIAGENDVWPWFLLSIAVSALPGLLLIRKKFRSGHFFAKEGFVLTALGWLILSLVGALPFFLSGRIPSYIDALFETASGFTTTGSSILSDVEAIGKGLLFWRSFTHWVGGMGVLVLILAIVPQGGGDKMQIMKAESPGPSVSKLVPRVRETALILYLIYIGMTVVMILSYFLSGMPLFDSVCIGFGTAGTGGFAVRNTGMAHYGAVSQLLITIWMILFGVNFNAYYLMVRRKWKEAFTIEEVFVYLGIIPVSIGILTFGVMQTGEGQAGGFLYSLHHASFTLASIISTTGFTTVNFDFWPAFGRSLLVIVMCIGACAGSTGGGIKVSRVILLFKEAKNELHLLVHPNAVRPVKLNGKTVDAGTLRSVNHYLIIYVSVFVLSVLLISFNGFDLTTNFTSVAATLNNIGPGLSQVGPVSNYSGFSVFSKLVLTFDMIAGRLELLPMLLLFSKKIWSRHY